MSSKFNNRTLLVVFLVLAAIFVISRFTSLKRSDRTLTGDLSEIDTSQVTAILLYPSAEQGAELTFSREGDAWTVSKEGLKAPADHRAITAALEDLAGLEAEQLVARDKDNWEQYQVTDSLGTRVVVREGRKTTMDLLVGRFHYQPPPQNSYNPYQQQRVSGSTYVRLSGAREVYSVEGFLAMSINHPFNRWRNQAVTRINSSQVGRITFDYPADSGYVAEKGDAGWMVAGLMADSMSMITYINRAARKSLDVFADGFQPAGEPDFRVSFEGDNMQTQQVRAWLQPDSTAVLSSSINPDSWFLSDPDGLFGDLYPGSGELLDKIE